MKAIILAAGRGSRMGSLTSEKPKCLTNICGKTLLDWQLDSLAKSGIDETNVTVIRGYKKEQLTGNYQTIDNPHWNEGNMVSSLRYASGLLEKEPCIVCYSDIVYHPDHLEKLMNADSDICITFDRNWETLWRSRLDNPLDDVETFLEENGRLIEIGEKAKSLDEIKGQFMGLLKFTPIGWCKTNESLDQLTLGQVNKLDMTGLLNLLLNKDFIINTIPIHGKWVEVDCVKDRDTYEQKIQEYHEGRWSHDWRN